jgi:hypothetical protein
MKVPVVGMRVSGVNLGGRWNRDEQAALHFSIDAALAEMRHWEAVRLRSSEAEQLIRNQRVAGSSPAGASR